MILRLSGSGKHAGPAAAFGDVPHINLLPESSQLRNLTQIRLRRWTLAGALAALSVVVAWQTSSRLGEEARVTRTALAEIDARIRQAEKLSASLTARASAMRRRQAVLDAMHADESWAQRLTSLAAELPDQVLLTQVVLDTNPGAKAAADSKAAPAAPPAKGAKPPAGAKAAAAATRAAVAQPHPAELRIAGYAADHAALALLLRRLEENGAFRRVELARSVSGSVGAGVALEFGITCRR